jgi:multisubunit Na+/H+ antiporter MnhC subunit
MKLIFYLVLLLIVAYGSYAIFEEIIKLPVLETIVLGVAILAPGIALLSFAYKQEKKRIKELRERDK